jgi:hypothetical protein
MHPTLTLKRKMENAQNKQVCQKRGAHQSQYIKKNRVRSVDVYHLLMSIADKYKDDLISDDKMASPVLKETLVAFEDPELDLASIIVW